MDKVKALINTSVADAKSSLECRLVNDPQAAKELAQKALEKLSPSFGSGNLTRIAMLRTIVRKADKLLAESK